MGVDRPSRLIHHTACAFPPEFRRKGFKFKVNPMLKQHRSALLRYIIPDSRIIIVPCFVLLQVHCIYSQMLLKTDIKASHKLKATLAFQMFHACMRGFSESPSFSWHPPPNISALPQGPQTANTPIALATHDRPCTCTSRVEISFPITCDLHETSRKRQNATLHIPAVVLGSIPSSPQGAWRQSAHGS